MEVGKSASRKVDTPIKCKNTTDSTIQEVPVMGYNQNNTIKMIQIIHQDCQRLDIQIIGWLIQDQYIWYFLDRTVSRIFAFNGGGKIRQSEGGYSD